jgi:hypothetical protein
MASPLSLKPGTLSLPYHTNSPDMSYRLLTLLLILCISVNTYAQTDFSKAYTKNFTTHTPNAFSFSKVDNIPLNAFTGQIKLNIPLYEKKMSILNFSLNADYTGGGGIKKDMPPTIMGRGWLLNTGGMIVRNKRGVPDDYKNMEIYQASVPTRYNGVLYNGGVQYKPDGESRINGVEPAYDYAEGTGDSQHDVFEYNVMGKSGKFYIGKNQEILIVTDSKMKIIPDFTNSAFPEFKLGSFLLIDEEGIKYYFDQVEEAITGEINPGNRALYFAKKYATSWVLTRIESPFNEESIQYEYTRREINTAFGGRGGYTKRSDQAVGSLFPGSASTIFEMDIKSITFSDGVKINFKYFLKAANPDNEFPLLKGIEVLNNQQELLKKYSFDYLDWSSGNKLLYTNTFPESVISYDPKYLFYLSGISAISENNNKQPLYGFSYFLGANYSEVNLGTRDGTDHWGYFNGKEKGTSLTISTQFGPAADRSPDLTYAQMGSLKKVVYPTGGSEEFVYELNNKRAGSTNVIVGGTRVKKRTLRDGVNPQNDIVKEYRYIEPDGLSSGFLGEEMEHTFVANVYHDDGGYPANPHLKYTITTSFIDPANPLSSVEGSFAGYRRVEELWQNASRSNGKIVYEFSDLTYTSLWVQTDYYPYRPVDRPYWALGLPVKTSYYANDMLVKEVVNEYNLVQQKKVVDNFRSLHTEKKGEVDMFMSSGTELRFIYKYNNYYPVIGRKELIGTHEYTYPSDKSSGVKHSLTQHVYDPNYYVMRATFRDNAKGGTNKEYYYYPFDYNLGATAFTTKLTEKNILNQQLARESWVTPVSGSSYLTHGEVVEHKILPDGSIRPFKLYTSRLTAPVTGTPGTFTNTALVPANRNMQVAMTFNTYDNIGRLLEFEKEGGLRSALLLDRYGNVTAKADYAAYGSIAYTGFETDDAGNWTYSPAGITVSAGNFGKRVYSGTISRSGLPTGNYNVSLMAKGTGTVTVNGVSKAVNATWALYQWPLNNISAVNINSNGTQIDEVSLSPADAQMSTSNYRKAMDVSSMTDFRSKTTYYDYDEFDRLTNERDQNTDILKNYEYKFTAPFSSAAKSGSFTKNNCPPSPGAPTVPGPPVTYNVQVNKYTSIVSKEDADAQAQSDVYMNGQDYANQHGTCVRIYYNAELYKPFTITCGTGTVPSPDVYYYHVPAEKYSSTVSQQLADAQANQEADQYGPGEAALRITCVPVLTVVVSNGAPENIEVNISGMGTTYTIPPGSGSISVPAGQYTVFMRSTSGARYRWYVGARTAVEGSSASFNNVNITNGTGSERNFGCIRIFN